MDIQNIWNDYGKQLRSFLASKVSTPEDAEDLLQEILIKTHQNLSTLKEPEKFKSWLYQIARNKIIDYYRSRNISTTGLDIPELNNLSDEKENIENHSYSELSKCLTPFLKNLPDKYREAIEQTELKGASQRDYADRLGISHSTVKSRVQRGRAMLKELYKQCCNYELDTRGNLLDFEQKPDFDC